MRLSALNIWKDGKARRSQQEAEVKENSSGPQRVWRKWEHGGWGDSISILNWDKRRIVGHTTPLPKKGDVLHMVLQSGNIGVFKMSDVEYCVDPSDMWFATLEPVGYLGQDVDERGKKP